MLPKKSLQELEEFLADVIKEHKEYLEKCLAEKLQKNDIAEMVQSARSSEIKFINMLKQNKLAFKESDEEKKEQLIKLVSEIGERSRKVSVDYGESLEKCNANITEKFYSKLTHRLTLTVKSLKSAPPAELASTIENKVDPVELGVQIMKVHVMSDRLVYLFYHQHHLELFEAEVIKNIGKCVVSVESDDRSMGKFFVAVRGVPQDISINEAITRLRECDGECKIRIGYVKAVDQINSQMKNLRNGKISEKRDIILTMPVTDWKGIMNLTEYSIRGNRYIVEDYLHDIDVAPKIEFDKLKIQGA